MPIFSDGFCGYEIIKRKEDFYDTIYIQSPTQRKSQRSDGRALRQCHPAVHQPKSDRIFPHLCRQHDLHYDPYRTDNYGRKRRDISDGISALTATTTLLSIFAGVFQTGITLFYLNTACNRPAVTANLFYGFKYLFKKSLGISAVLILLNTACTLPFDICYFLLRSGKGFDTITMAILCIVLMVIGMCIYIPLSLGLSQAYYLLLDFPQYSAMELMKLSFRIMKGHKWELFCLQMSFLPLGFLCLLSFGIGSLWLVPYMNMTQTLYFLDLMQNERQ